MSADRRNPGVLLALAGGILVVTTTMVGSGFNPLAMPFTLWALLPYGVLFLIARAGASPWVAAGAGLLALSLEIGVRASVFVWPRGSTAAVALVFSPLYILLIGLPAGAAGGWVAARAWRRHVIGRALVLLATPLLVALVVVGLARPELFPTNVLRRRDLLARVGPPRVLAGGETFVSTVVSTSPQWSFGGDVDVAPGEELVLVEHAGATLVDPLTLERRERIAFADRSGRLWGSFSTLVRLPGGERAVVQTGGGFSRTQVQDLDGTTRWEYRPDPKLTPDALRPADLDGDGAIEFYAATTDAIARLDASGQVVWRQPATLASIPALLPRDGTQPAWVVALEYGRRLLVFDSNGRTLTERAAPTERTLAAVEYAGGRCVVEGETVLRGVDLAGATRFELPLGDFSAVQVIGLRLAAGTGALVVVGAAGRDARRWRLTVFDENRAVTYDEILDVAPRVFTVRRAAGDDVLFVASERGLRRLTPVQR
jgi:hypothetical protein